MPVSDCHLPAAGSICLPDELCRLLVTTPSHRAVMGPQYDSFGSAWTRSALKARFTPGGDVALTMALTFTQLRMESSPSKEPCGKAACGCRSWIRNHHLVRPHLSAFFGVSGPRAVKSAAKWLAHGIKRPFDRSHVPLRSTDEQCAINPWRYMKSNPAAGD